MNPIASFSETWSLNVMATPFFQGDVVQGIDGSGAGFPPLKAVRTSLMEMLRSRADAGI
jgi:hypothetical protein